MLPSSWRQHLATPAATAGSLSDSADIATASGKKFLFDPLRPLVTGSDGVTHAEKVVRVPI